VATAYNRADLASALRTFAQIPLWGTSDTLVTLYAIPQINSEILQREFKV